MTFGENFNVGESDFWYLSSATLFVNSPQSSLTLSHICGHVTRGTWNLRVPGERSFVVDDSRHWNFSIWSTNKGVMAILVEGCNSKNEKKPWKKHMLLGCSKNGLVLEKKFIGHLLHFPENRGGGRP